MKFTDKDLKLLREKVANNPKRRDFLLTHTTVDGILHRLKAAEEFMRAVYLDPDFGITQTAKRRLDAWKKEAGR